ncbi:MAG: type secretion system protein [Anaerocolumna sp.]|nr:type secretion system protein [Anaerocolumna sp.]
MPSFAYIVIDNKGKEKKGAMEAANSEKVISNLRAEGLIPISVMPQNMLNKDINISIGNPVKPRDLSIFCRQFMSILTAGVSIISALDMLQEQTENKVLSVALKEVQTAVEKGETLTDALSEHRKIFPNIMIHMIEAGEASGNLEIAFERMAVHFEKDSKLRARMKKAMIYPSIVGLVAVGVIFLMMMVVIPNFMSMFKDLDIELPALTKAVIGASDFFQSKWYIVLLVIGIIIAGIRYLKSTPSGQLFLGRLAFKLPLFGKLTTKSISSRFARTLSTLLAAGIPMIEAIEITARTIDNTIAKEVLLEATEEVAKGVPLSVIIKRSGIFPPMVSHMTKIGEETGNLESMLTKMADYYDEEVEMATDSLMAAMEPMIIVFLALVVGVLIMSIMQPMLSMYEGLDNL